MKRRHFLSTTLAASGGIITSCRGETGETLSTPNVYTPPEDELVRVSIFHTTDLHGHIRPTLNYDGDDDLGGFARCLSQIRRWRKSKTPNLTLDIGDLYQGTHVSLETKGELMIELLNAANYDAWVAGNHDFDWGEKVFRKAVADSEMPVLSNNLEVDGHTTGHQHHAKGEYKNLLPSFIKEVGGMKIGIFGITTPGLPFWLNPGQLGSIKAIDPLIATQQTIRELKDQGAQCIIAAGHMGLKYSGGDDYANQVNRLVIGCPEIDVYIAGHTHRDQPSTVIGNTLFTQAGYYGIWAGKLDLTFHKEDSKLIRRNAETRLMDSKVKLDPLALEISNKAIEKSDRELAAKVGRLDVEVKEGSFDSTGPDTQSLIAASMMHVLSKKGDTLDGVLHGTFSRDLITASDKTLADLWEILPYENRIVAATLTGEQLIAITEEAYSQGYGKRLVGFVVDAKWDRETRIRKILSIKTPSGQAIDPAKNYRIGFNSYDAQSGGRRLLLLRETLQKSKAKTVYHPIDTRAAMADFFLDRETVTLKDLNM